MGEFYDVYENTVRLAETDATGILFFGTYTVYMDEALIEYFDEIGFGRETTFERGWNLAIVNVELDFRSYTDFGDRIVNQFRVSELGEKSFTGEYRARSAEDDELLAEGSITSVIIDESGDPIAVPDELREAITRYQDGI